MIIVNTIDPIQDEISPFPSLQTTSLIKKVCIFDKRSQSKEQEKKG